ncbi:ribonuclease H protein, partial [Trifolium medium]|nr:ribonuclease H protein [Trifolium medium]
GDPERANFGGLIRHGDGKWIIGFSGYLGIANNTFPELMALYHGLKIAREAGNSCADFLAKLGSANDAKLSIWESPPLNIHDILLSDALRVPYARA